MSDRESVLIYKPVGLEEPTGKGNQSQRWMIREFHLEENDQGPLGAEKNEVKVNICIYIVMRPGWLKFNKVSFLMIW